MSGRDWQWPLQDDEMLLWQGRPAPRCYVFRRWKQATVGTVLFFASSFWLLLAYQLMQTDGYPWWLLLIPAPLVIGFLLLGPGALILSRVRWEQVFYALTDERLLLRGGLLKARVESVCLADVVDWKQKNYGAQLASLRLQLKNKRPLFLLCLEQPQNLLAHLAREVKKPVAKGDSV